MGETGRQPSVSPISSVGPRLALICGPIGHEVAGRSEILYVDQRDHIDDELCRCTDRFRVVARLAAAIGRRDRLRHRSDVLRSRCADPSPRLRRVDRCSRSRCVHQWVLERLARVTPLLDIVRERTARSGIASTLRTSSILAAADCSSPDVSKTSSCSRPGRSSVTGKWSVMSITAVISPRRSIIPRWHVASGVHGSNRPERR